MSRIHEALKRAEQERAMPLPPPPVVEVPQRRAPDTTVPKETRSVAEDPEPFSSTAQVPTADLSGGDFRGADVPETDVPATELLDPLGPRHMDIRTGTADFLRFDDLWNRCANPGWRFNLERNVFVDPGVPLSVTEQFRTLRSRLYQIRDKQPLRTVLVTSSMPGEGKTFVANNLAQALAHQQNCKVLLIDADLRRPDLHSGLGAPVSPGLSDYLKAEADEMSIIQRGVPEYLCFIPGGSHTDKSADLLANGRLKTLLENIGGIFDWVILDSPPTLPVSDALLLADVCDGVLTVVRAAQTEFDAAQKCCHQLREKNLLGVALNCADEGLSYNSYYCYEESASALTS